ncbi:MAG: alpha-amylase, partial [Polyangiales bacterium]
IFARTWAHLPPSPQQPLATGEFWAAAIHAVRTRYPDFAFVAEAYWELEGRLQRLGFDFTYDKALYDRLLHGDAAAIRAHLGADLEYQARSVRFVENHDEPRIAHELEPARRAAALVIAMTVPGMRFVHDGQVEGRRVRTSVHLGKRVPEAVEPGALAIHATLFEVLRLPALRQGAFRVLAGSGSVIAHRWEHPHGSVVVAVNYSGDEAFAQFPVELHGIEGRSVMLQDRMSSVEYARDGTELVDPARGLFVKLAPWQAHVFVVR